MSLALLCPDIDITSFVNSLDDLNELFKKVNPLLNEFFRHAFCNSKYSDKIDAIEYNFRSESQIVLSHNSSIMSAQQMSDMLNPRNASERDKAKS